MINSAKKVLRPPPHRRPRAAPCPLSAQFVPEAIKLLDSDGSKGLDKSEVLWITKFAKTLRSGELKNLTRDVFEALDADGDDSLTASEVATDDEATLAKVVTLVHATLPLPNLLVDTADAEQRATLSKHLTSALAMLDGDGDGTATRAEAGAAFKSFRGVFLKAAKTLREMGPMLAMFGAMGDGGMGGMGGKGGGARPKPRKQEL